MRAVARRLGLSCLLVGFGCDSKPAEETKEAATPPETPPAEPSTEGDNEPPPPPGVVTPPPPPDPHCDPKYTASCDAACKKDDGRACVVLAGLHEHGREGRTIDYAKAHVAYDKACTLGEQDGCAGLGFGYVFGLAAPVDYAKAEGLFETACDKESGVGCFGLGWLAMYGPQRSYDPKAAFAHFERSCELGDLEGCHEVGLSLEIGRGAEKDETRALAYFRMSCTDEVHAGCIDIAWAKWRGSLGFTADAKTAYSEFRKLCDVAKVPAGCYGAGRLAHRGEGTEQDDEAALRDYTLACEHGHAGACVKRATTLMYPRDASDEAVAEGIALLERMCNHNNARGCYVLGNIRQSPRYDRNLAKAENAYAKACARDHTKACLALGWLHTQEEEDWPKNPAKALAEYQKVCDKGTQRGCFLAAQIMRAPGDVKDPVAARALHANTCEEGKYVESCMVYAKMLEEGEGGDKDVKESKAVLEKTCADPKNVDACSNAAFGLISRRFEPTDPKMGVAIMNRLCEAEVADPAAFVARRDEPKHGAESDCRHLASFYFEGEDLDQDLKKAVAYWQKACDVGDDWACRGLGDEWVSGSTLEQKEEEGLELLQRACDIDDVHCDDVAWALIDIAPPTGNAEDGLERLDKRCKAGKSEACSLLANAYASWRGPEHVEADSAKQLAAQEAGCAIETNTSLFDKRDLLCHFAASARLREYNEGQYDPKKGIKLHERACELGYAGSCGALSDLYKDGLEGHLEKDATKAEEYRVIACDAGNKHWCEHEGH